MVNSCRDRLSLNPEHCLRLALCILLLLHLTALADTGIYRVVKPDGSVLYTDRPDDTAERVELGSGNRYQTAPTPAPATADASPEPAQTAPATPEYHISLTEPAADTATRAPGGRFSVRVSIDPEPAEDLYVIAYVNGEAGNDPVPAASDTRLEAFSEIPGDQQLQVVLLDAEEQVIARSATQSIHLLRRTLLQPPPANPAPNWNPPGNS